MNILDYLNPLICKCCGGQIDRVNFICKSCGTAYTNLAELDKKIHRLERKLNGEPSLGTWTKLGTCENDDYRCSLCDHISNMAKPYCPHCKGLMDMQNISVVEFGYKDTIKTMKEDYKNMKAAEKC